MQVIDAANEVIDSIDRDELAKFFSLKSDPDDEEAEVLLRLPVCLSPYPSPSLNHAVQFHLGIQESILSELKLLNMLVFFFKKFDAL